MEQITVEGVPLSEHLANKKALEIKRHMQSEAASACRRGAHHHITRQELRSGRKGRKAAGFDVLLWGRFSKLLNSGCPFNQAAVACGMSIDNALRYFAHFVTRVTGQQLSAPITQAPNARDQVRSPRAFDPELWEKLEVAINSKRLLKDVAAEFGLRRKDMRCVQARNVRHCDLAAVCASR